MKKNKVKYTEEEKQELSVHSKRLTMRLLLMLFVIYALIVFAIAWFSSTYSVSTSGMGAKVKDVASKDFILYKWDNTLNENLGGWVVTDGINLQNSVPNEVERYMAVSQVAYDSVEFTLNTKTIANDNPANESLFDYIYITNMKEETTNVNPTEYVTNLPELFSYDDIANDTSVGSSINSSDKYSFTTNSSKTVIFDVYISKDVCNYFNSWSFSGTLVVE